MTGSPFLAVPEHDWLLSNDAAFAIADRFPVSEGHALVIPRRQIPTWWDATDQERADLLSLVDDVRRLLDERYGPDGYNVGFNAGAAAGQTVDHLHIHVIPRYAGDVPDPRGGVRHVIPHKANYLAPWLVDDMLREQLVRCLRDPRFDRIDLVVSFIMTSGVDLIAGALSDALARGARVRILTTDYLGVTDPDALTGLLDLMDVPEHDIDVRIFHDELTSFHPKSYIFRAADGSGATAFVGSSNLSASGITDGIEWNLGVEEIGALVSAFERLWADERTLPLTHNWLRAYREKPRVSPVGVVPEPPVQPAEPWPIQREALDALEATREEGHRAGLVVMATGLGKTWLAAFDATRPEFRRVLFVAHREEILRQSRDVFRQVRPDADLGFFDGTHKQPDARVLFASIQTLAGHLDAFDPSDFDYVVVDEFHHAAAMTYRRVIGHFEPDFLLGLTATPERLDGADLLALCGDNLVFEADAVDGIRRGELCPFRYFGVRDVVDYTPIPWRNGRFDPRTLAEAVETHDRATRALEEWREKGHGRTLAFCTTISHADFMARFFAEHGVRAVAVHTGEASAPRHETIEALRAGDLDVVFAVDMFNEGLDVPGIETVLMLRPTESPVVFLQQFGRGLRRDEGKDHLTVIDFIGNHRSFLIKPRTLLALSRDGVPSTTTVLDAMREERFDLPPGCSVTYELGVVDMLRELVRRRPKSALADYLRAALEETGERPTALQAYRAGVDPRSVRPDTWFGFLASEGLLTDDEERVYERHREVLDDFEKEPIAKAYKLVTLLALLRDGHLREGAGISRIAATAHRIVVSDPRLVRDTESKEIPDPAAVTRDAWRGYWRKWPIAAWAGELRGRPGRWFRIEGERLVPTFEVADEDGETFDAMVAEIVDYRLARYLFGKGSDPGPGPEPEGDDETELGGEA